MIIGISGKKQTGKDLSAKIWKLLDYYYNYMPSKVKKDKKHYKQFVIDNLDNNKLLNTCSSWEIKSFSTLIKKICSLLTNIPMHMFENGEFKSFIVPPTKDVTYRDLLIKTADFYKGILGEDIYVEDTVKDYQQSYKWIISDVRYKNEFNIIKELKGINIRIENHKFLRNMSEVPSTISKSLLASIDDYLKRNPCTEKKRWFGFFNNSVYPVIGEYINIDSCNGNYSFITDILKGKSYSLDTSQHHSETELDDCLDFDYVIKWDFDIEILIDQIRHIMKLNNFIQYEIK